MRAKELIEILKKVPDDFYVNMHVPMGTFAIHTYFIGPNELLLSSHEEDFVF